MRLDLLAAALLVPAAGCFDLPDVPAEVCGNGVLEPGEDCDGVSPEGGGCAGPAEEHACRVVCADGDGCPLGRGCGFDDVCRRPTGAFEIVDAPDPFAVDAFAVGDVDGDGRADVIGHNLSEIAVRYGGEGRTFAAAVDSPTRVPSGEMTFGDFDGDGRIDAVVPLEDGIVVLAGDPDRTLQPRAFAPLTLGSADIEVFSMEARPGAEIETAYLDRSTGGIGFLGASPANEIALPGDPSLLARPIPVADVDGDGRQEAVLGFLGGSTLTVLTSDGITAAALAFVDEATVALPAPLSGGALFADVDGDGDRDLVAEVTGVAEAPRLVVSINAAGVLGAAGEVAGLNGFPDELVDALALPLAAGDLDGDGRADYVFPGYAALSVGGAGAPTALLPIAFPPTGTSWDDAAIADLNGDGLDDFVTGYRAQPGADVYLSTGGLSNRFHVDADGPVKSAPRSLVVGDVDGDRVVDAAFVQDGQVVRDDAVAVVFGSRSGGFGRAVSMGRFDRVSQLLATSAVSGLDTLDSIADLLAVVVEAVEPGADGPDLLHVATLYGDPSRQMAAPFALRAETDELSVPERAVIGDFDNDARQDLLVVARPHRAFDGASEAATVGEVWFLPGRADGSIDPAGVEFATVTSGVDAFDPLCASWAVGDMDGDQGSYRELVGVDNLATCNFLAADSARASSLLMVHVGTDAGIDIAAQRLAVDGEAVRSPERLDLADLDLDGDLDMLLLFRGDWWLEPGADTAVPGAGVAVLWNRGDGEPVDGEEPSLVPAPAGYLDYLAARPIELDGDGWADLLVLTDAGFFHALFHGASGGFTELAPLVDAAGASEVAVGDLDGDGLDDFAFVTDGILRVAYHVPAPPRGDGDVPAAATGGGAP